MNKSFTSHVALPGPAKQKLVENLNSMLATAIDLRMQVKQAHWNVKGPQFFARHELFDKLATRLAASADEIAERAATLGGYAEGTVRLCAQASRLPEYDLRATDGRQHIQALVARFETYTQLLRDGVSLAEKQSDPVTADLYTEALRGAELDMWFLESHINV